MGLSLGGLASGLDSAALIANLMALERQPRTRLLASQTAEKANRDALQKAVDVLRTLQERTKALTDPGLFGAKQTVEVTDPAAATATISGGAAAGGFTLEVVGLARAAGASYAYAAPAAATTLTVSGGGWNDQIEVAAGTSARDLATRINGDAGLHVVASVTTVAGVERLHLANRATGAAGAISATASAAGVLSDEALTAGRDAVVRIDGVERTSATNVLDDAIPGVELRLRGVTAAATTVTVSVPGVDGDGVQKAVEAFVSAYNAAGDTLRALTAVDKNSRGQLGGDATLIAAVGQLRDALYGAGGATLPLTALGLTTGAPSGTATFSRDAVLGKLQLDPAVLRSALTADPAEARELLGGSGSVLRELDRVITAYASTSGVLGDRISRTSAQISDLGRRMDDLDSRLAAREASLKAQFARLEATISKYQDQGTWLSGQIAQLGSRSA
ncbi:flagellar filament capping protein FliD [Patulibacter defluvii]|uniref:flagellar filament capping protein FliD n=1 Tax=Patulibacter defluvii TaxID=3095358 RepID=UPI002A748EB9|nr:flagellar filament capping protein FliD [Patulibacter sp. DM4]